MAERADPVIASVSCIGCGAKMAEGGTLWADGWVCGECSADPTAGKGKVIDLMLALKRSLAKYPRPSPQSDPEPER